MQVERHGSYVSQSRPGGCPPRSRERWLWISAQRVQDSGSKGPQGSRDLSSNQLQDTDWRRTFAQRMGLQNFWTRLRTSDECESLRSRPCAVSDASPVLVSLYVLQLILQHDHRLSLAHATDNSQCRIYGCSHVLTTLPWILNSAVLGI